LHPAWGRDGGSWETVVTAEVVWSQALAGTLVPELGGCQHVVEPQSS
jgi:hypothetical protein